MKPKQNVIQISVKVLQKDVEYIAARVECGNFMSQSDFVRQAIKEKINKDLGEATA